LKIVWHVAYRAPTDSGYGSDDGDDDVGGPAVITVNDGDDADDEYF
jgi:hypothetical protein